MYSFQLYDKKNMYTEKKGKTDQTYECMVFEQIDSKMGNKQLYKKQQ